MAHFYWIFFAACGEISLCRRLRVWVCIMQPNPNILQHPSAAGCIQEIGFSLQGLGDAGLQGCRKNFSAFLLFFSFSFSKSGGEMCKCSLAETLLNSLVFFGEAPAVIFHFSGARTSLHQSVLPSTGPKAKEMRKKRKEKNNTSCAD